MTIISIIILLIGLVLSFQAYKKSKQVHSINIEVDKANQLKQEQSNKLDQEIQEKRKNIEDIEDEQERLLRQYTCDIHDKETTLKQVSHDVKTKQEQLEDLQKNVTNTIDNQKKLSQVAFENYCETLTKSYTEKEEEYTNSLRLLTESYQNIQNNFLQDLEQKKEEIAGELQKEREILDKVRETRAAAMEAQLREQEIKDKLSFYCLTIKDSELDDIKILERVKDQLHAPRILSMLIQQTYFQKPMTTLCNNIIGTSVKSGIYKITNQKNNICYIGQAVDLATRWKQHAKCGLGIDTPQGNKLYKAMNEDGLWNFSFEVLEFCPSAELNEKEKYYIELYQSKEFGYNSQAGNSK